jgi:hypothetical protein
MIELPEFPRYSTSLWDYLGDMAYMPSAEDRELVRKKGHRVQIWDYFFRPNPEDVGRPIRRELMERQAEAASREAESQQGLQQKLEALARLEQTRQEEQAVVDAQLLAIEREAAAREKAQARKRITIGTILGGGSFLAGFVLLTANSTASSITAESCAIGCLLTMWFLLGVPTMFYGAWLAYSGNSRLAPEKIQALVAVQQEQVRRSWAQRALILTNAMEREREQAASHREVLGRLVPHLRARIAFLERLLEELLDQLPPLATEDQVEAWRVDDLQDCSERGAEKLGVVGRTINLLGTTNPFMIVGPAEIQDPGAIPRMYSRSTDPDRRKYLHARRFGTTADGRAVKHYAVFHVEVLYITGAVLARYSVFFDFIRGEYISESAPQQHFADVVLLEMRKEYRQIVVDGKEIDLDQAPSMILALSSGDRVSITLPSAEYFAAVGADAVAKGEYDAMTAADSALKAITERVNEAKRNLEVSQIARMKEKD